MANVILFHHALGLTDGVRAFADRLRAAGHRVTTPDLYEGKTFKTLDEGVAQADGIGMMEIIKRGVAAAAEVPGPCVYAGFSLGMLPAQKLAQSRPDALGAILYYGAVAAADLGSAWPKNVALQIHLTEKDKWAEVDVARQLADEAGGELFVYPGAAHLVCETGFEEYDHTIAEAIIEHSIQFLNRWD